MHLARRLRLLLSLLAACLLAAPASATWSIVFVNHATREVAVGTATCLSNFDLKTGVPVIWVGAGAGAAQSVLDVQGVNRRILRNGLRSGLTPDEILDELLFGGGTQPGRRQYGIAAFTGTAATWTGGQAGLAKFGVTGQVGDISYAIQGNLLAGDAVVLECEEALRNAKGSSAEILLAGMKAAAIAGGDGRCSCPGPDPTGCGAPPASFTKSAHAGVMIVARMGDTNGNCNSSGCAKGDYYLDFNVIGDNSDPDPVRTLQAMHETWHDALVGRPDGVLSTLHTSADRLPADGETKLDVLLRLVDVDGVPLAGGGAAIEVVPSGTNPTPLVDVGPIVDHGGGVYSFQLRAGMQVGLEELVVTADDGVEKATLYPNLEVRLDAPAALHAGRERVSFGERESVPFVLNEADAPGATYLLLGTASGTAPGLSLGGVSVPLNPDAFLTHTLLGGPDLVNSLGTLDARGRAEARWTATPALLGYLAGTRLSWVALSFDGTLRASNVVEIEAGL